MFSTFDPTSMTYPTFLLLMMIIVMAQISKSKTEIMKKTTFKFMSKEISPNMESKNQKSSTKKFIAIFSFIIMMNLGGLLPSSFSMTSHMSLNLPMALMMWISTNMFSMMKKTKKTMAHMVPNGTPMLLSPFMVLIEMVSNIIRPITLSVRLTANMVAGHILISLMENFVINTNPNTILSFLMASTLTILETGVAIIQSYVFSILITLYFSENH
uniref:ATP synthase F0 subunit 6 n=1 Tax=Pentidionis agamae TaxID=3091002 RepID=UPI0030024C02|nr:ATP synthase F0 subunit 6 [Pentidionis agamae]